MTEFDLISIDQVHFLGPDVSNGTNRLVVTLGKYDPKRRYLTVYDGFNMKGTCKNSQCEGYKQGVWVKKDYGVMNIGGVRFGNKCPCCQSKMDSASFKTFGYKKAKIEFDGTRVINDQDEEFHWQDEERQGKFIKFKDEDQNLCQWDSLIVNVMPIEKK